MARGPRRAALLCSETATTTTARAAGVQVCKCATGDNWDLAVCEASKAGEATPTAAVRRSTAQSSPHRVGAAQQQHPRTHAPTPSHPRTLAPSPGHGGWLRRTPFADLRTARLLYDCVGSANETALRACRPSSQRLPWSPRDSARGVIVIMAQAYAVGGSQPGSTSSWAPRAPLTPALPTTARSTLAQQGRAGRACLCAVDERGGGGGGGAA
jgi:hypothetical protein